MRDESLERGDRSWAPEVSDSSTGCTGILRLVNNNTVCVGEESRVRRSCACTRSFNNPMLGAVVQKSLIHSSYTACYSADEPLGVLLDVIRTRYIYRKRAKSLFAGRHDHARAQTGSVVWIGVYIYIYPYMFILFIWYIFIYIYIYHVYTYINNTCRIRSRLYHRREEDKYIRRNE